MVAEAFARTERAADAAALYEFVLKNRTDIGERTATIQKALALLSMADAEKLIAMGRVGPDGRSEFDVIRVDIARARIAAFLRNDPAKTVDAADLAAVEEAARRPPMPASRGCSPGMPIGSAGSTRRSTGSSCRSTVKATP